MTQDVKPNAKREDRNYDTKTFVWHNSPSRFSVMVTRLNTANGGPFAIEGFDGDVVIFTGFTGGKMESHYDPYSLGMAHNEDNLRAFLVEIERGVNTGGISGINWREIDDGREYTPEEVGEMISGGE